MLQACRPGCEDLIKSLERASDKHQPRTHLTIFLYHWTTTRVLQDWENDMQWLRTSRAWARIGQFHQRQKCFEKVQKCLRSLGSNHLQPWVLSRTRETFCFSQARQAYQEAVNLDVTQHGCLANLAQLEARHWIDFFAHDYTCDRHVTCVFVWCTENTLVTRTWFVIGMSLDPHFIWGFEISLLDDCDSQTQNSINDCERLPSPQIANNCVILKAHAGNVSTAKDAGWVATFSFFCGGQNIVLNSLSRKEMLEAALKLDPLNKASNANWLVQGSGLASVGGLLWLIVRISVIQPV